MSSEPSSQLYALINHQIFKLIRMQEGPSPAWTGSAVRTGSYWGSGFISNNPNISFLYVCPYQNVIFLIIIQTHKVQVSLCHPCFDSSVTYKYINSVNVLKLVFTSLPVWRQVYGPIRFRGPRSVSFIIRFIDFKSLTQRSDMNSVTNIKSDKI